MSAGTTVQYGTTSGSYPMSASGNSTFYTYGKTTSPLLHRVWMTGLPLNTTIFYRVGDASAWSAEYSFVSSPGVGAIYPYTIGFVADIGESSDAMSTVAHVVAGLGDVNEMVSGQSRQALRGRRAAPARECAIAHALACITPPTPSSRSSRATSRTRPAARPRAATTGMRTVA